MMKKLHVLLIALMLVILTACGNGAEPKPAENNKEPVSDQKGAEESFPVTIKDGVDKDVVIEKKPEKIVSLAPSNTEIVYALGEGDAVIGVGDSDNYPEEVADKEVIANMMELNVEKIISLQPDLVLAHGMVVNMWGEGLKQLEESGITVLVVHDAQSFDAVYSTIEMIGKATGATEKASALISDMKTKLDDMKKQAEAISEDEQKTVYVEVSPAPEIFAMGQNTFINEMIELINAKNVVTEDGWVPMNEEAVIALNPDAIITTTENDAAQVLERTAWKDISAIKNKQVYEVDGDLVTRSGPRIVEGVEELAKAIYPDVFGK